MEYNLLLSLILDDLSIPIIAVHRMWVGEAMSANSTHSHSLSLTNFLDRHLNQYVKYIYMEFKYMRSEYGTRNCHQFRLQSFPKWRNKMMQVNVWKQLKWMNVIVSLMLLFYFIFCCWLLSSSWSMLLLLLSVVKSHGHCMPHWEQLKWSRLEIYTNARFIPLSLTHTQTYTNIDINETQLNLMATAGKLNWVDDQARQWLLQSMMVWRSISMPLQHRIMIQCHYLVGWGERG